MGEQIIPHEVLIAQMKIQFGDFLVKRDGANIRNFYSHAVFPDVMAARNKAICDTDVFHNGEGAKWEKPRLPKCKGFDADDEVKDYPELLSSMFPKRLLEAARVSEIINKPDVVDVMLDQANQYFLTLGAYKRMKLAFPQVADIKTRAENLVKFNVTRRSLTPIFVYSFVDDDPTNLEYLDSFDDADKMRLYKVGTINHEIGHNLYLNFLNVDQQGEWRQVVEQTGPLTAYSKKYIDGTHASQSNPSEEFAEAVRLMTTAPNYLENTFGVVWQFFKKYLPDVRPVV